MKRSEMIKRIGSTIYLELGSNIRDLNTANRLANLLIERIELYGMLPPKAVHDDGQNGKYWDNLWEPEEESL